MKEIKTYDDNGNLIYHRYPTGLDIMYVYDENNNCTHVKCSNAIECDRKYNDEGKLLHVRYNDGFEFWFDYKADSPKVYIKNANTNKPPLVRTI